ncbi:MAG TPA: hypothetical protein VHD63_29395 [Ktedonobacteraceae bacterium]|nr:hypothetical protein [Ktedonobacteraceae bacterium]
MFDREEIRCFEMRIIWCVSLQRLLAVYLDWSPRNPHYPSPGE